MKILHAYRTFFPDPPGGLQEAIRHISLSCSHYGHQSKVFALSPDPAPTNLSIHGVTVSRSRSWTAPASCDIGGLDSIRLFKEMADWADIVHFHFPWPFLDVLNLFLPQTKPRVMTYHSDIVRQQILGLAYAPLMWRTLRSMDQIVATSPQYVRASPVLTKMDARKPIRVIPLGLDEASYFSELNNGDNDVLNNGGETVPYILFIGVLRYYKGLHILLEACQKFCAQVWIAGSGPEQERLQALKSQLNLTNVRFLGQISEQQKVKLIRNCTALVLPSQVRSEAFGMVMVEASMMGKPLISCEIDSGTSFVNVDGETGLVVSPGSPDALAQAMSTLISDRALATKLGSGARVRYEQQFSGKALGDAYSRLYTDILLDRDIASSVRS